MATPKKPSPRPTSSDLPPSAEDFEKLGMFYLGRPYDLVAKKVKPGLLLYDSKDLVTHAIRGLPDGPYSICPISSASPSIQAAKPGAASRLFNCMARANRSLEGKKDSRSSTPTFATGGDWTS